MGFALIQRYHQLDKASQSRCNSLRPKKIADLVMRGGVAASIFGVQIIDTDVSYVAKSVFKPGARQPSAGTRLVP